MITNINESLSSIENDLSNGVITEEESISKRNAIIKTYIIESMAEINIDHNEGFISEDVRDAYNEAYAALFDSMYEDADTEFIRKTMCDVYTEAAEKKKIKITKAEYEAIMAKKNAEKNDSEKEKEERKARRKERLKTAGKVALGVGAAAALAAGGFAAAKKLSEKAEARRAAAEERARKAAIVGGVTSNSEFLAIKKAYEKERKKVIDKYDMKYKLAGTSYAKEQIGAEKEKALEAIEDKYAVKFEALYEKFRSKYGSKKEMQDDLEASGKKMAHIADLEAKDTAKAFGPGKLITKLKYKGIKKKEGYKS